MKRYLHTEHQLTPNSLCCIVTFGSTSGRGFLRSSPSLQGYVTPSHQHLGKQHTLMQTYKLLKPPLKVNVSRIFKFQRGLLLPLLHKPDSDGWLWLQQQLTFRVLTRKLALRRRFFGVLPADENKNQLANQKKRLPSSELKLVLFRTRKQSRGPRWEELT